MAGDISHSLVTEHVFVSRSGLQFDLCVCGLARSAHEREDEPYDTAPLPYRCPDCVTREAVACICERGA